MLYNYTGSVINQHMTFLGLTSAITEPPPSLPEREGITCSVALPCAGTFKGLGAAEADPEPVSDSLENTGNRNEALQANRNEETSSTATGAGCRLQLPSPCPTTPAASLQGADNILMCKADKVTCTIAPTAHAYCSHPLRLCLSKSQPRLEAGVPEYQWTPGLERDAIIFAGVCECMCQYPHLTMRAISFPVSVSISCICKGTSTSAQPHEPPPSAPMR
jgi:hypothetical protein